MQSNLIYLLHGKGGSSDGTVRLLEEALTPLLPGAQFIRPLLPHSDPMRLTQDSVTFLQEMQIPAGAFLVGISLGGLVAAKLQETGRTDLDVICISSPTWADAVYLQQCMSNRTAIYSSTDTVILGRTSEWPRLAQAFDLPWLTHATREYLDILSQAIAAHVNGENRLEKILGLLQS